MYAYTDFDANFITARNAQFRDQVARRIDGSLTEDEFKPLRLMNGLYLQLHAYMLRVAIPYGTLNSARMDRLAYIAERWDKGYGHFTTRQNIQYNWPELRDVPDMLDALAEVNMHAIQTSGNTIRNVTADHFAGAAADEIADPRPVAELIRQWSTDHPEFQFLPRKFKVAVSGAAHDRAVLRAHDIGLQIVEQDGAQGYRVIVGGGLGRTPMIGKVLYDFVASEDLLPTLEAIVSVYNLLGRRDNKYKARIKITVHENGIEDIRARVDARYALIRPQFTGVDQQMLARIEADFALPAFKTAPLDAYNAAYEADPVFRAWADTNLHPHRAEGYAIVSISLKAHGATPGDATAAQMREMADLARQYGHDELRISHGLHQCLRASPCGAYRHPWPRPCRRGELSDHAGRGRHRGRGHRRACRTRFLGRRDHPRDRADRDGLSGPAPREGRDVSANLPPSGAGALQGGALSGGKGRCRLMTLYLCVLARSTQG